MCTLLRDESSAATSTNASGLPSNTEAMNILETQPDVFNYDESNRTLRLNQLCMTFWDDNGKPSWSIGYFICDYNNGTFVIELLQREKLGKDLYWIHPVNEDTTEELQLTDIFPITPTGDWEVSKTGVIRFKLRNGTKIRTLFKKQSQM